MHYFAWGGRSVAHTLVQFFLMYDKSVFNIANAAAYILLLAVICAHILGKRKWNPGLIIVINAALFAFTSAFGQDFLWLTGACNYLWGGLLSFSYLLAFRFQLEQEEPVISKLLPSVLFGLWGIICAWTNENMAVTMVVLALLFNGYTYILKGKCYRWSVFATIGIMIGAAIMIGAPGNFARLESEVVSGVEKLPSFIERLATTTFYFVEQDYLLIPIAIVLICCIMKDKENIDLSFWFYAIGLVVSMYSMIAAPYFVYRAKLASLIFGIIMAGRFLTNMEISQMKFRKLWAVLVIAAIASTATNFIVGGRYIIEYNDLHESRMEVISQAKAEGNLDPVVPGRISQTRFCGGWGLDYIVMDPNGMWNKIFAKYYGLNTVRADTDVLRDVIQDAQRE